MKRVRVAPGRHVIISAAVAEKAARVFASAPTREQVHELAGHEPRNTAGLLIGRNLPLKLTWRRSETVSVKTVSADGPCSGQGQDQEFSRCDAR